MLMFMQMKTILKRLSGQKTRLKSNIDQQSCLLGQQSIPLLQYITLLKLDIHLGPPED